MLMARSPLLGKLNTYYDDLIKEALELYRRAKGV
jgi:hypothetical protein